MADRIGTEIESDSEKAEVKMTNSEIVEYAIHYAQDHGSYPPNLTKEKRAVRNCAQLLY